jgi:hypothetical protein
VRWLILGGILLLLAVAVWLYSRFTREGPDREWSERQDTGTRQAERSRWGI